MTALFKFKSLSEIITAINDFALLGKERLVDYKIIHKCAVKDLLNYVCYVVKMYRPLILYYNK